METVTLKGIERKVLLALKIRGYLKITAAVEVGVIPRGIALVHGVCRRIEEVLKLMSPIGRRVIHGFQTEVGKKSDIKYLAKSDKIQAYIQEPAN